MKYKNWFYPSLTALLIFTQGCTPTLSQNSFQKPTDPNKHCLSLYPQGSSQHQRCMDGLVALDSGTPMKDFASVNAAGSSDSRSYWNRHCKTDFMTDTESCSVMQIINSHSGKYGEESIAVSATKSELYIVADNIYSHREAMIRVDNNTPFVASIVAEDAAVFKLSPRLKHELYSGNLLKIRYVEWPSTIYIEEILLLNGFAALHRAL